MYRLHLTGPDNDSTFPSCWGSSSRNGPVQAVSVSLVGLYEFIRALGHDNFAVWSGANRIAASRREYYARPAVARYVARRRRVLEVA
jgi:hypothetical protein